MKLRVWEDHSSTVRHRGYRETSSAFQRVDFDGSALINFFVGSASHRVGDGLSRHWVVSVVRRVGGSYRRSAPALRRQCVASRRVGIHWRWHSADFGGTAVCWLQQNGGWSTTCVIVIATIKYELFVTERFVGNTGNRGLVRQLNLFNASLWI